MSTDEQFDAAFGLTRGTVRGWLRAGVIPSPPTEHAVIAALTSRPALSADKLTVRGYAVRRNEITAAHRAAVHASLSRAPEAECPMWSSTESADCAATAAAV